MEVGCLSNDQYLFRRISHEYEKIRRDHEWRLSLVMPQSVSDFFDRYVSKNWPSLSSYGSNLLTKLCNALAKARVHTIASGDFVRFQLVPIGDQCCPRWFKAREVPPEEEVRAKRYHYEPVPMDDVEFADIPLKHLMKPGPHTDKFWITTFPKKLDLQLVRPAGQNGQRVIGWGIHIKEKLNWPYILLVMFAMLLVSSGAVAIYAIVTSDHSSAFGLGAFLVALMTVYITYQYFAWKEQDS
ncbi:hypothetical protein F5Y16DRAFT_338820 [Xylariaceae sp. FL0255]|nr:hypothetical protein F5Y16DRAFT_338820 [Xylariaceae sp. FL0255]